jgi:hypothetical protein
MQTAHPSRGVKQHTTFLQIFSARLSGTSVLALTIFFDLGKSFRSLSLTGLLNLRLGSRPPSSSALYPRWSHAFSCYFLCFGHPSPILNASPPPSHLSSSFSSCFVYQASKARVLYCSFGPTCSLLAIPMHTKQHCINEEFSIGFTVFNFPFPTMNHPVAPRLPLSFLRVDYKFLWLRNNLFCSLRLNYLP